MLSPLTPLGLNHRCPMSQYNSTAIIVDDHDSSIIFSPGWLKVTTGAEYNNTKSGAQQAGMTATFIFNGRSSMRISICGLTRALIGTGVEVYGSVGSYDVCGVPIPSYELDGLPASEVQYQAQIIEPPHFTWNTMFYRSALLQPDQHTLVITNLNGTPPAAFWIDYIIYTPSGGVA